MNRLGHELRPSVCKISTMSLRDMMKMNSVSPALRAVLHTACRAQRTSEQARHSPGNHNWPV